MITKIVAPTNNVNDTSVEIYELLVENNSHVKKGQNIIVIETSKATENIESPVDGIIRLMISVGDEVPNGEILAIVGDSIEEIGGFETSAMPVSIHDSSDTSESVIEEKEINVLKISGDSKDSVFGIFDHTVTLGEIMVKDGDKVSYDMILCKVRDGNNTEIIKAPDTGYVHWNKKVYETVKAGEAIGIISASAVPNDLNTEIPVGTDKHASLRISKSAQELLTQKGLTAEKLGLSGLVTVNAVMKKLNSEKEDIKASVIHTVEGSYNKLSRAKRSEAAYLSAANRETVVSQASVLVSTQGIISACAESQELAERFSAIIIFETSRLLRKYPLLMSVYDEGQLFTYDYVNVGYALALDDGLKVPVLKNSDKKDLEMIIEEKRHFIEKYILKELSPDDLNGGTFTITDMSSTGCYMFNPVLNLGQSAILGIGGENTMHTDYPLILAYDHRVVDGAIAAEFLCALRDRLIAHENILLGMIKNPEGISTEEPPADTDNLTCESCYRGVDELDEMGHYLLKVIDKTGKEKHICSICVKGW